MNKAFDVFQECIDSTRRLGCVYDKLHHDFPILKTEVDDILRVELINAISAMDRFIHEIVCIGMIEIYQEKRLPTSKWKSIKFSHDSIKKLIDVGKNMVQPNCNGDIEIVKILNEEFKPILKTLSFQQPDKIKDALSHIWNEEHKMQKIAGSMTSLKGTDLNQKQKYLEQKLQLIVNRRNCIVHEADWDSSNGSKYLINKKEVDDAIEFVEDFVSAIYSNVCITP